MFANLLNKSLTVRRLTDELMAERTIAANMAPTLSAGQTCCAMVTVSGADIAGTVTVIGPVAGVSTSEALTFNGSDYFRQTLNQFDNGALVAVLTSGLTGNIKVDARTPDGSPVLAYQTLASGFAGRIDPKSSNRHVGTAGQESRYDAMLYMLPMSTLLLGGDRVIDGSVSYRILPRYDLTDGLTVHHWEIPLVQESRN